MKSNCIIAGLLLSSISLNAQPIITQANYQPLNNGTYGYYVSDTTITPGNSGADVLWDFSNISQGELFNYSVISCNGNGDCDDFVGANYFTESNGYRIFYINDVTGEQKNGQVGGAMKIIYTNPLQRIEFPMEYLSSYSDTFASYYESPPAPPNSTGDGFKNAIIDGYGTLKTPNGTYTNVLRQKTNLTINYSANLGFPQQIEEDYIWYQAGISHPIMSIINKVSYGQKSVVYTNTPPKNNNTSINNIDEKNLSFEIYPNPTTGFFNINFENQKVDAIIVKDILGKVVFTKEITGVNNGGNFVTVNASGWSKGIYLVEIVTTNHSSVKKIIVE